MRTQIGSKQLLTVFCFDKCLFARELPFKIHWLILTCVKPALVSIHHAIGPIEPRKSDAMTNRLVCAGLVAVKPPLRYQISWWFILGFGDCAAWCLPEMGEFVSRNYGRCNLKVGSSVVLTPLEEQARPRNAQGVPLQGRAACDGHRPVKKNNFFQCCFWGCISPDLMSPMKDNHKTSEHPLWQREVDHKREKSPPPQKKRE